MILKSGCALLCLPFCCAVYRMICMRVCMSARTSQRRHMEQTMDDDCDDDKFLNVCRCECVYVWLISLVGLFDAFRFAQCYVFTIKSFQTNIFCAHINSSCEWLFFMYRSQLFPYQWFSHFSSIRRHFHWHIFLFFYFTFFDTLKWCYVAFEFDSFNVLCNAICLRVWLRSVIYAPNSNQPIDRREIRLE